LEIEHAIRQEQDKLSKIELAKKDIRQEQIAINYNVSIKSVPGYQVLSLRRVVPSYYDEGLLWREMSAFAKKNQLTVSSDTFTIYHDTEYKENNVEIEVCAPVALMGKDVDGFTFRNTEPIPVMACTMVYGPFKNIASAYFALASWLQEHRQYKINGQNRQIVHRGPWNEASPDNYLTEIQIPLEKL
jgi:effector-binding domain-containing protein